MADERPEVDDRDPADAVAQMVAHVLRLAETWGAWDGRPLPADDRVYTPHKAIRRVADHMIDHLVQLEGHVAGAEPLPDRWHGSSMTTPADLAPFTPEDLDEARSRLERLAQLWRIRLAAIPPEKLDRAEGDAYTPREMAFCAVGSRRERHEHSSGASNRWDWWTGARSASDRQDVSVRAVGRCSR